MKVSIPPLKREEPKSSGSLKWFAIIAVVGVAGFVALRASTTAGPEEPPGSPNEQPQPPINVLYTDLPAGAQVHDGEGWLDVHAPNGTVVLVDGVEHSSGAIVAGNHELRAGSRTKTVDVRAGKNARVDWP